MIDFDFELEECQDDKILDDILRLLMVCPDDRLFDEYDKIMASLSKDDLERLLIGMSLRRLSSSDDPRKLLRYKEIR